MSTAVLPPGPRGSFPFGVAGEFARNPLRFVNECARGYGDIVGMRFFRTPAVLVSHPEQVEHVLGHHYRDFRKGIGLRTPMMRLLLGSGLLTSEGEFWVRQRRLAQPAFHRERIAEYGAEMVAAARRMLSGWRDGETRDVHQEMTRLTLEIVTRTLFGIEIPEETERARAALDVVVVEFERQQFGMQALLQGIFPTPGYRRVQRAIRELDGIVFEIIRRRRASGADAGDLLSMLLHARDEDGSGMDDQALRDEAMTLFLAGHETTALALSWAWYLLATHPEAEASLHAELERELAGRAPTFEDLPRLRFADMVIRETMRLYPPVWMMARAALEETELGGYRIPKGAEVMVCQWLAHRDPRSFAEPERFLPERWEDDLQKRLPRGAYFPFGGGPRACIGSAFATMEAVLVLATIAQRVRLPLAPGHTVTPWATMGLRPKDGVHVVVRDRGREAASAQRDAVAAGR